MGYRNALKGKYIPANPQKYRGDLSNIVYRSSYELKFCRWCDNNKNVLQWSSEPFPIPYMSPVDNAPHRYFIDFIVKVKQRNGDVETLFVEIKPEKQTKPPEPPKSGKRTPRFLEESVTWEVNKSKWDAAAGFAAKNDARFIIMTERDLGIRR